MGIPCNTMLSLPYANQFRVLAGKSGLGNLVQWVHNLEDPRYVEWLRGGELIILTGIITKDDAKVLCRLMEQLFDKQVAAVAVSLSEFIPVVPKEVCACCDRLGLPLLELPAHVRIVDISRSIGTTISNSQKWNDERAILLLDLLYGKRLSEKRLRRFGFHAQQHFRVVQVQLLWEHSAVEASRLQGEMVFYEEENLLYQAKTYIQEELQKQKQDCWLTADDDMILWLIETEPEKRVAPLLRYIMLCLQEKLPDTDIQVGVSEEFTDIRRLRSYAEHARKALFLNPQRDVEAPIAFYDDMVSYQLFEQARTSLDLNEMAARVLGNLLREEHRDLLNSLRRYIEHDCNQKDAAKALFCHVNTLYFRLKKIERMLHRDLNRMDDLFDLMLALRLYDFCQDELGGK